MSNNVNVLRGFQLVSKYLVMGKQPDIFKMPSRASKHSACYDIYNNTDEDIILEPGEISKAITTHIKIKMPMNNVCKFFVRSGHGFKYSVKLANSTGIIDADYYDNPKNEGECLVKFHNQGDKQLTIPKGEAMAQAMFQEYLLTDDDDDTVGGVRVGGLGSTSK